MSAGAKRSSEGGTPSSLGYVPSTPLAQRALEVLTQATGPGIHPEADHLLDPESREPVLGAPAGAVMIAVLRAHAILALDQLRTQPIKGRSYTVRAHPPEPDGPDLAELAADLARDLFVDGQGRRATRLVHEWGDRSTDGTGWGEKIVAGRIEAALRRALG